MAKPSGNELRGTASGMVSEIVDEGEAEIKSSKVSCCIRAGRSQQADGDVRGNVVS